MDPDRDLERAERKTDLGLEQERKPEDEWHAQSTEELELDQGNQFSAVTTAVKQAVGEGKVAEELLLQVSESHREALEAIALASMGAEDKAQLTSAIHLSALARMRLLNQALAELQPVFAPAMGPEHRALHERLMEVAELTEELRKELGQRILLETATNGPDREEALDSDEEDEDEDGNAEDEGEKKKGIVAGFGALLAGARRREKGKKNARTPKKGNTMGEDGDDGSSL